MPTIRQLSRIFSDDSTLNRVQDQLASALNPILRNVQGDLTGPLESPQVKGLRGINISQTPPITGQSLVYNGTEWAAAAGGGLITSVTAPLVVTSGVLSIPPADATTDGYLTSVDWVAFDGKVSSVTATAPMSSTGGTTPDLSMTQADSTTDGWLSSTDWNTFNNKIGPGDPTVVLLMAGTGTTGSTTFPDTSYIVAPLTANGNTQIAATPSKFGGGSAYFDGSGDTITAPANSAYDFGTGDFTLEAFVYFVAMSGDYAVLSPQSGGGLFFGFRSGTNIGIGRHMIAWDYDTPSGITTGGWYHIAVCRASSSVRLFVDGTQVGTTQTITYSYNVGLGGLIIGAGYNGYMNEVRASNVARYTANFTPPTAPFPPANPPVASGPAGGVLYGNYPNPSAIQPTSVVGTDAFLPVRPGVNGTTWIRLNTDNSSSNSFGIMGPASGTSSAPGNITVMPGAWTSAGTNGGASATVIGGQAQGMLTGAGTGGTATLVGGTGGYSSSTSGTGGDAFVLGGTGGGSGTAGAGGNARVRGGFSAGGSSTSSLWGNVYVGDDYTQNVYLGASTRKTHIEGPTVLTPPATQTITAATDSFTPNRTFLPFNVTGGNHTLTSTPTIATTGAVIGQMVLLMNVNSTNHIRLTRGTAEALSLSNANPTIDPGGSMLLVFNGTYWVEVMHTQATTT